MVNAVLDNKKYKERSSITQDANDVEINSSKASI